MNSILMIVIAVVILLLVFVMFSLDEQEDEVDFLAEEPDGEETGVIARENINEEVASTASDPGSVPSEKTALNSTPSKPVSVGVTKKMNSIPIIEKGGEEDLRLRLDVRQRLPLPVESLGEKTVVAAIQLRFSGDNLENKKEFNKALKEAELLLERDFSFDFSCYPATQLNRFWFFNSDSESDDPLFEALVVAFEVVSRFKKALETSALLQESKAKVTVGLSSGEMVKVDRGFIAEPSWVGMPAYLAETLAEAAGDFSIYVDEKIHKAALPLFDFREWKPIKLRSPLPAVPIYELVGWNKPDEIASFAAHPEAASRRAVAVAYRYLALDDHAQPLLELLSDSDEKVALEALGTIKEIGSDSCLGLLKKIFPEAQEPIFRSAIIDAFASIGRSEVVPVILGSTKEGSWKVRYSAAKALYKLSGKESLRHLEDLLEDGDGAVKAAVNSIFYRETGKSTYLENMRDLMDDLSIRARKSTADELLSLDNEKTIQIIVDSFADQEFELQRYILGKLEFSKSKLLYQCFLTIFKITDERIRPYIIEAVRRSELVS